MKHKCVNCKHFVNRVRGTRGGTMGMCAYSQADRGHFNREQELRYSKPKACKRLEPTDPNEIQMDLS